MYFSKGGCCNRVKWLLSWPLSCLLYYTVPNCLLPHWERWFMVTFVASTLWIAVFSYLMVWMVCIIVLFKRKCLIYRTVLALNVNSVLSYYIPYSAFQVTIISFTLDIPDVIMGITFLAAGTSVPDCMASLIVARQGTYTWQDFFFALNHLILLNHILFVNALWISRYGGHGCV